MSAPMNAMELDEVRRWAEQRTNPDDGATTVAETYLRLLATVADARRAAIEECAKAVDTLSVPVGSAYRANQEAVLAIRALLDDAAKPLSDQFVECASCAAKPGSPMLCKDCYARRKAWGDRHAR